MTNTTHTHDLNERLKNIAFIGILSIIIMTWMGIDELTGMATTEMLFGAILIGLNFARFYNAIPMSRLTFMAGAFFLSHGFLAGATLYFPLAGLLIAAWAIFNALEKRANA